MKKEKHKTCECPRKSFGVGRKPTRIISGQKNRIEIAEETPLCVCALDFFFLFFEHS